MTQDIFGRTPLPLLRFNEFPDAFDALWHVDGATYDLVVRPEAPESFYGFSARVAGRFILFDDLDDLSATLQTGRVEIPIAVRVRTKSGELERASLVIDMVPTTTRPGYPSFTARVFACGQEVSLGENTSRNLDDVLRDLNTKCGEHFALNICRCCAYAAFEPSTGWGHLYCFFAAGEQYWRAASLPGVKRRNGIWSLWYHALPTSEVAECERFTPRPHSNFGYA